MTLTWHVQERSSHRSLVCRGYSTGSYEERSAYQAVCTVFLFAGGRTGELEGLHSHFGLSHQDFVALLTALNAVGVQEIVAERVGKVVVYDTRTARKVK